MNVLRFLLYTHIAFQEAIVFFFSDLCFPSLGMLGDTQQSGQRHVEPDGGSRNGQWAWIGLFGSGE